MLKSFKEIAHNKAACFLLGAVITFNVALIYLFHQVIQQHNNDSLHYEYLQKKGLDKNSPFVIEPAKDGSYTVVANSKDVMFNGKIALAAQDWQNRTGIVFKIAYKMPKNKQGVIPVKDVKHYLSKNRKDVLLGTTHADLGMAKTGTIRISQEANEDCGTDVYQIAVHELGHAIGVSHNPKDNNDIMNPYMRKRQSITQQRQSITQRDIRIAKENHQVLMHDLKQDK